MSLIISVEPFDDSPGPLYIDAIFPVPIRAFALAYSWCEDEPENCTFAGFVLDEPVTRFSLWEPGGCEHSWCAIDAVYWQPVPEPATGLLVTLGLVAFARRARTRRLD